MAVLRRLTSSASSVSNTIKGAPPVFSDTFSRNICLRRRSKAAMGLADFEMPAEVMFAHSRLWLGAMSRVVVIVTPLSFRKHRYLLWFTGIAMPLRACQRPLAFQRVFAEIWPREANPGLAGGSLNLPLAPFFIA